MPRKRSSWPAPHHAKAGHSASALVSETSAQPCDPDSIGLVAKRLDHIPNSEPPRVRIISDNALYAPYDCTGEEVNIIGQIRWFAREI
jgi:hypothetical protein